MSDMPPEGGQVQIGWPEEALWPQGGYANVILVNHTPWDFTLRFGHVVLPSMAPSAEMPDQVQATAIPIAQVTLSPVTLRQLSLVLQQQVARYISTYGEIGGPSDEGIA